MDEGSVSAQALNRNSGEGLGGLQERVEAGLGRWRGAGGQAQVRKNLDNHRRIVNGRDEGQSTAALRTGGEVDGEHSFE